MISFCSAMASIVSRHGGNQIVNHGLDDDPKLMHLMGVRVKKALGIGNRIKWHSLASRAKDALESSIFVSAYDTGE